MCDKVRCFLKSPWPTTCHKVFDEDVKKGVDKYKDRGRTRYPQVRVPFQGLYSAHIIDIFICLTFCSGSSAPPHTHCPPLPRPQFTAISTLPESPNCACIILAPFVIVQNLLKSVYMHMYQISNVFAKQNELVLSRISCHCHQSRVRAQGLHQISNVFAKPNELVLSRIAHHRHQSCVRAQGSWT